ncbi:MAG: DUF1501 domain-containing protein [Pseudomonadota bacterium]
MDRRQLLKGLGAAGLISCAPVFAATPDDRRFVVVILRGALDGLAVLPPVGDPDYAKLRGELALTGPGRPGGVLPVDDLFGLHPAMPTLHTLFENGEATFLHAVASPYRERSHFDGQDLLEKGTRSVVGVRDGWLNRALHPLGGGSGKEAAIALSQNMPLILRGSQSVSSWAPSRLPDVSDNTLDRLQDLYADDAFFATRLAQAMDSQEIAGNMASGRVRQNQQFASTMASAARFLTAENGPRIAVIEAGGWDTHANQGAAEGQLANRLGGLDAGLGKLKAELGPAWDKTAVAVVTEFGRTVRVNGTRGTDHGTGTAAILAGGAINGGHVIADWPGLADRELYQNRDLNPTTDLRSVFKSVLEDHLQLSRGFIESDVFPDSRDAASIRDLLRS